MHEQIVSHVFSIKSTIENIMLELMHIQEDLMPQVHAYISTRATIRELGA